MNIAEILPLLAALLGFLAVEAYYVLPAIKRDDETPAKFSWSFYFSRPANQVQTFMNACGTALLFIARHEVLGFAERIPVASDYLGYGSPFLLCGVIGMGGGFFVRWAVKKMGTAE